MFREIIGIDVSKNSIDVYFANQDKHIKVANETEKLRKLFSNCSKDTLVVLENTGGYEDACMDVLADKNCFIHKTHNNRVKNYIRSL